MLIHPLRAFSFIFFVFFQIFLLEAASVSLAGLLPGLGLDLTMKLEDLGDLLLVFWELRELIQVRCF